MNRMYESIQLLQSQLVSSGTPQQFSMGTPMVQQRLMDTHVTTCRPLVVQWHLDLEGSSQCPTWGRRRFHLTRHIFLGHHCQAICRGTTILKPEPDSRKDLIISSKLPRLVCPPPLVDLSHRRSNPPLMRTQDQPRLIHLRITPQAFVEAFRPRHSRHLILSTNSMADSTLTTVLFSTRVFTHIHRHGNQAIKIIRTSPNLMRPFLPTLTGLRTSWTTSVAQIVVGLSS